MKAYKEMTIAEIREIVNIGGPEKRKLNIEVQTHIENIFDKLSDKGRYF